MSTYTFCNIATLGDPLVEKSRRPAADDQALQGAVREASELGRRAYLEAISGDAAVAERLLYYIHRNSAFGPPVPALPAVVWAILIQTKLDALLTSRPTGQLEADQMVAQLEHGVATAGTHVHPLLDDLVGEGSLRGYRVFLKNWYGMASGFTEFLISVAQRATPAMRGGIVENLSEEIFDETPHIDLRARVLEGAGVRFDPIGAPEDRDIVTETFALINWRAAVSSLSDPCLALGLFYSIEANWQFESRRHLAALRTLGISDDHLTSLIIHVERDEDHAGEWLAMIRKTVTDPRDRAVVVQGLSVELAVRQRMYDAMRRHLYGR